MLSTMYQCTIAEAFFQALIVGKCFSMECSIMAGEVSSSGLHIAEATCVRDRHRMHLHHRSQAGPCACCTCRFPSDICNISQFLNPVSSSAQV